MLNLSNIEVELMEYCVIEETVKLPTTTVKVSIPKLTVDASKGKKYAKSSILVNASACRPKVTGSVVLSDSIILKVFSNIMDSPSVDKVIVSYDPIRYEYYLRKGTQMIACFMDKNINDGYLTNFI